MDPTTGYAGDASALAAYAAFMSTYMIVWFVLLVIMLVAVWRVFTKAGEAGWQAIIPIWNTIVLLKIAGRPWWWILLMLIPFVNIVILCIVYYDIAKSFGYGFGFTVGLILLPMIFWLILALGSSRYVGPGGVAAAPPMPAYAAPAAAAAAVPTAAPPPPVAAPPAPVPAVEPPPAPAPAGPAPAAPPVETAPPAPAAEPPAPPAE